MLFSAVRASSFFVLKMAYTFESCYVRYFHKKLLRPIIYIRPVFMHDLSDIIRESFFFMRTERRTLRKPFYNIKRS